MPCSFEEQGPLGGVNGVWLYTLAVTGVRGSRTALLSSLFTWHVCALTAPTVPCGRNSHTADTDVSRVAVGSRAVIRCGAFRSWPACFGCDPSSGRGDLLIFLL